MADLRVHELHLSVRLQYVTWVFTYLRNMVLNIWSDFFVSHPSASVLHAILISIYMELKVLWNDFHSASCYEPCFVLLQNRALHAMLIHSQCVCVF